MARKVKHGAQPQAVVLVQRKIIMKAARVHYDYRPSERANKNEHLVMSQQPVHRVE